MSIESDKIKALNNLEIKFKSYEGWQKDSHTLLYLPFDGEMTDLTGRTWTIHGTPQWCDGPFEGEKALFFPANNSSFWMESLGNLITGTTPRTMDLWVKIGNSASGDICGINYGGNTYCSWAMGMRNINAISLYQYGRDVDMSITDCFNKWVHMAFVNDGGTTHCYVNGIQRGTVAIGSTVDWPFRIGNGCAFGIAKNIAVAHIRMSNDQKWTTGGFALPLTYTQG